MSTIQRRRARPAQVAAAAPRTAATARPAKRASSIKPILVLRKARRILDTFDIKASGLTFTEVAERSELAPSTCLRLLYSLVEEGFLDKENDRYRPGLRLLSWSSAGVGDADISRRARAVLERLRDETSETACLFVRDRHVRTCIALAETRHTVVQVIRVGQVMALHAGSGGKLFLAYMPDLARDILARSLERFTDTTITEASALREELDRIRKNGYAVSFGERDDGSASISAPVFNLHGDLVATIGIMGPLQRLNGRTARRWIEDVKRAGVQLSTLMGHVGNTKTKRA